MATSLLTCLIFSAISILAAVASFAPQLLTKEVKEITMRPASDELSQVLAAETANRLKGEISFNLPSTFNADVAIKADASVSGNLTAPNILYGLVAGSNITISGDLQRPTISATSSGVNSFQGRTGDLALTAGTGIAIDGLSISSNLSTFKNFKIGSDTISAGSSTDTFEFVAGSNISFSTDTSNKKLTISGSTPTTSGWTDDGTIVRLTTSTDSVGIGTAAPAATLDVEGTFLVSGTTTFGGLAYTWPGTQSNSYILQTNGSGTLSWIDPGTLPSSNFFDQVLGTITPKIETQDFLLGGQATTSAKFAVLNMNSGTPTASVSAGATGGMYIAANGTLQTTNNQTLNIGGNTTGNIVLSGRNGANNSIQFTGYGTGLLHSSATGVITSSALNLEGGSNELTGALPVANGGLGAVLSPATAGEILYSTSTAAYGTLAAGALNQCLISGGTGAPFWTNCGIGSSINWWNSTQGAVYPINSTLDLLLGSTASTSSKIAFININSGTPTASISANSGANAAFLAGNGRLGTTNMQSLSLGGSTTGEILLSPSNDAAGGTIRPNINNVTDLGRSTFNFRNVYATTFNSGSNIGQTVGTASCVTTVGGIVTGSGSCPSVSGVGIFSTGNGTIFEDNITQDFLLGGQASSSAKFAVLNMNSGTPTASLSAGAAGGSYLTAAGLLQTTANQALTIGGTTTGDISLYPRNGSGALSLNVGSLSINGSAGITSASPTCVSFTNGIVTGSGGCGAGSGGSIWVLGTSTGVIYPINNTMDILIGGTATSSARAAFLNIAGGTPTASVSAGAAGAAYLTADGTLQTTAGQGLNIGSGTTGNIVLDSGNNVIRLSDLTTNGPVYTSGGNGTLNSEAQLNVARGGTGVNGSTASNGQLLIGNGSGYTLATLTAGSGITITNGSGTISIAQTGSGASKWTQNATDGTLYPNISTLDLLIGGSSTTSAKFAFLNNAGGTPVASIAGNIVLDNTGSLQTTKNQAFTLGGNTTGNITIAPLNGNGVTTNTGTFNLASGKSYQINGTDVLSATTLGTGVTTSSLTTVGALASGSIASGFGTIATTNTITGTVLNGTTGINTGAAGGTQRIDSSGNLTSIGTTQFNTITYTWPSSGQSSGYALVTNGSGTLSWADLGASVSNYWRLNNGALYPANSSVDLLIGGTATTSAKFAVLNMNSGTPTASLSAGSSGGAYLTAAGTLQTTANQTLNLGGSSTGDIILQPRNNSGMVGINTLTPTASLTVKQGGTSNMVIITDTSGNEALNINNNGWATFRPVGTDGLAYNFKDTSGSFTKFSINTSFGAVGINTSAFTSQAADPALAIVTNATTQIGLRISPVNSSQTADYFQIQNASGTNLAKFDVNGYLGIGAGATTLLGTADIRALSGTLPVASISGRTSFAGLLVDNSLGDLITASNSGFTRFRIRNNGAFNVTGEGLDSSGTVNSIDATVTATAGLASGTTFRTYAAAPSASSLSLFGNYNNIEYSTTYTANWTGDLIANLNQVNWRGTGNSSTGRLIGSTGKVVTYSGAGTVENSIGLMSEATFDGGTVTNAYGARIYNPTGTSTVTNAYGVYINSVTKGSTLNYALYSAGATNYFGGQVGIGIATPATGVALDTRALSGTTPVASISGNTSFAGLLIDNTGVGDLLTASKSGAPKFTILNNGNISWAGQSNFQNIFMTSATAARSYTFPDATGTVCLSGQTCSSSGIVGYWQRVSNALVPANISDDLLLGNISTSSARFAVLNMAGGTPTASLSAGAAGGAYLTATGVLATTANQQLVIGNTTTGNVVLAPGGTSALTVDAFGSGTIGLDLGITRYLGVGTSASSGTQVRIQTINSSTVGFDVTGSSNQTANLLNLNPSFGNTQAWFDESGNLRIGGTAPDTGKLNITGAYTGKALAILDETGNQDIFTASKSGVTKFTILSNGNLSWTGTGSFLNTLSTNTTSSQTYTFPDATGTVCLSGQTCSSSGIVGYWQRVLGALAPANITDDLFIGGLATSSAAFHVYGAAASQNVNPVASIAANTTYAGLVIDNRTGDLFTASSSGLSRFVIRQSGNIGIGNISAMAQLAADAHIHVADTLSAVTAGVANLSLFLQSNTNTDSTGPGLGFTTSTSNLNLGAKIVFVRTGSQSQGDLAFYTKPNTTLGDTTTEKLRITSAGAVGIGTTTPAGTLDIRGNTATTPFASMSGSTNFAGLVVDNRGNGDLFTASSSGLPRFIIRQGGRVSIAETDNPAGFNLGIVTISGNNASGNISALALNNNGGGGGSSVALDFYTTGLNGGIPQASIRGLDDGNFANHLTFSTKVPGGAGNALTERMRLTSNGLLGLNTTSPLGTLDVRPNIVNGGTIAIASVSGKTSFAGLVVDNSGVGDIFTASASGLNRFVIANNGNVGINTRIPTANLQITQTHSYTSALSISSATPVDLGDANVFVIYDNGGTSRIQYSNLVRQTTISGGNSSIWGSAALSVNTDDSGATPLRVAGASGQTANIFEAYATGTTDRKFAINPSGTISTASVSANTSSAGLVVDNSGSGDIFTASSSGQTRLVMSKNGNVNIGTQSAVTKPFKFYVSDYQPATASAMIENTAQNFNLSTGKCANGAVTGCHTGLLIKMGANNSTTPGSTDRFIQFVMGNDTILGKIRGAANATSVVYDTGGGDYAEWFEKEDASEVFNMGDVICLSANGKATKCTAGSNSILGAISDNSGFVGNSAHDDDPEHNVLVGLLGHIMVNVSTINGNIKPGDMLTASSNGETGIATKATHAGIVLGRALEKYTNSNSAGKIMVYVSPIWYDPDIHLSDTGNINVFEKTGAPAVDNTSLFGVKDNSGQEINRVGVFSDAVVANLKSGSIDVQKLSLAGQDITGKIDQTASQTAVLNSAVSGLNGRVASLEAELSSLSSLNSQLLSFSASTGAQLSLDKLDINDASINTLAVLGRTLLQDVGITGKITAGVLTIRGLDTDGQASINTIGDLKLQDQGTGGINILNGKIIVDTKGDINITGTVTAKTVNTTKLNIVEDTTATTSATLSASAGSITINAGQTTFDVDTTALTANSLIFVTPDQPVLIGATKKDADTFTIKLQSPAASNIKVNWWIVN